MGAHLPPHRRLLFLEDGCIVWTGGKTSAGYGLFTMAKQKLYAHRYFYELVSGEIPEKMDLDHLCRNRACVNPEHLEPVTHRENVLRGAMVALKTECKNGHPWIRENIGKGKATSARGEYHFCLICRRERDRLREPRKRKAS